MDNSLSESARFAVYREKLKGICEANNLSYVFIKNASIPQNFPTVRAPSFRAAHLCWEVFILPKMRVS